LNSTDYLAVDGKAPSAEKASKAVNEALFG